MNLSGFCAADPSQCGQSSAPPPPPPNGTPTAGEIYNSPASGLASKVASAVGSSLLNIAARVGRTVVCPYLPGLGAAIGSGIAAGLDIGEVSVTGPLGIAIAISAGALGEEIGRAAGTELQQKLCS